VIDHSFEKPYDFFSINFQKYGLDKYYHNFNHLKISKQDSSDISNTEKI
jgi:hypothetical protein